MTWFAGFEAGRLGYAGPVMMLRVEFEREDDGRWIADVLDRPGVLCYGDTRETALAAAQALALRVIADQIEHGEAPAGPLTLRFVETVAS